MFAAQLKAAQTADHAMILGDRGCQFCGAANDLAGRHFRMRAAVVLHACDQILEESIALEDRRMFAGSQHG